MGDQSHLDRRHGTEIIDEKRIVAISRQSSGKPLGHGGNNAACLLQGNPFGTGFAVNAEPQFPLVRL